MDEEYKNRLSKDLMKSGFYSELQALHTLSSCQWGCSGSPNFYDLDENKSRETDFVAYLHDEHEISQNKNIIKSINSSFYILGEIKKSETAWIVFREYRSPEDSLFNDAWANNIIAKINSTVPGPEMMGALIRNGLMAQTGWIGRSIHESFKEPKKSTRWYSAFVTASKAAENGFRSSHINKVEDAPPDDDESEEEIDMEYGYDPRYSTFFEFYKPLVVLDGPLIAADLNKDGTLDYEPIKYAPFVFSYLSPRYTRSNYNVDLVTLGALPEYLELCNNRRKDIFNTLVEWSTRDWPEIYK